MICLDCSVAVQLFLPESHSRHADALVTETLRNGDEFVAPVLLPFEVANVLGRQIIKQTLTPAAAEACLRRFEALPFTFLSAPNVSTQSLRIANELNLPAIYDATYLVVSRLLHCDYWTDDLALLRAVDSRFPRVRWIGDYDPTRS